MPNIPCDFVWVFITHVYDAHLILFSTGNKSIFLFIFQFSSFPLLFFLCEKFAILRFESFCLKILQNLNALKSQSQHQINSHFFSSSFCSCSQKEREKRKKMLKNLWKLFQIPVISFRSEYTLCIIYEQKREREL